MLEHIGPIVERVMAKLTRPDELDDTLVRLLAEHEIAVDAFAVIRRNINGDRVTVEQLRNAVGTSRAALLRHIGLLSQPPADSFPEAVT